MKCLPRGKNVNGDDCYQDGGGDIDGDYGNVTMAVFSKVLKIFT